MISIYKDTNTINANNNDEYINLIEQLAEKYPNDLIIEKTDVLDTELLENPNYNRNRLKKSNDYIESYGIAVLDHSRLGHSVVGSNDDDKVFSEVLKIIFGKKMRSEYSKREIRDAMHVITAIRYGGAYLITSDKEMLNASKKIFDRFKSLKIYSPKECLQLVKRRLKLINNSR